LIRGIYGAILERSRAPIHDISEALAVPAPLVEFIFEIPLKTRLKASRPDMEWRILPDGRKVSARLRLQSRYG